MIIYGSVCSGIESASVAWEPLGFLPLWFSEIEPFPCSVLKHHWSHIPNFGDMTQLPAAMKAGILEAPDVLVGGTPCQAFSIAGSRKGLADERGQLTMTYVELLNAIDKQRPGNECVCVWENVPGVLSSKDNAFGCFLAALCGEEEPLQPTGKKWSNAGYVSGPQRSIAWRILDAQYFGVAQRRRRVFLVASARTGFDPTEVLFESEGVRRDTPPSREAGPPVATLISSGVGTCDADDNQAQAGQLIPDVAKCLNAGGMRRIDYETETFILITGNITHSLNTANNGKGCSEDGTGRGVPIVAIRTAQTSSNGWGINEEGVAYTLDGAQEQAVQQHLAVRRLTPVECERLQGFPDGHTDVPHRGKPAADGPRYKAIGNSKAVPVVKWIGERLKRQIDKS